MNDMESIYVIRTVLLLGVLLVLSAVFSASETGITSSGRGKLLALQERHPFSKTFLAWLLADVQRALTITLISNNLVNIAASAVATSLAIMLFGSSGVWLSVVCMTFLIVLFGEILPKTVAIVRSESTLLVTIPVIRFIGFILFPFIWLMMGIVRIIGVVFGVDLKNQHTFITREEIEQMVNIGEASGVFEEVERKMIHGVIAFEETRVYEIMVPRTDMDAIPLNATVTDAVALFEKHGHSRVPVFRDSFDDIVGILYAKDVLPYWKNNGTQVTLDELKRDVTFVPETKKVSILLREFQQEKKHLAIVVDDMIDTAGTLCAGADVLLKNGATKIVACATHAVLSGPAIDRINSTEALSQVFVTDTIPMGDKLERCPKLEVVSVAALLGKTIHNIHTGSSVSVLFV